VPQPPAPSSAEQQQQQLRLVSGSADKTLRLWDAATRRTLKISRKLPSEVMCLAVTR
jgi:WD40 repeat protein